MQSSRRLVITAGLASLVLLVAAACAGGDDAEGSSAGGKPTIKMTFSGTTQLDDVVGYHVMELMRQKGYNVNEQRLESNVARPAFLANQVDFVEQSAKIAIGYVSAGEKITCFAGHDAKNVYIPVVKGITSADQIPADPRVGVSQDNGIDSISWDVQRKGLGKPSGTQRVVVGGQSARSAALLSGQIDVAPLGIGTALQTEAKDPQVHILREYVKYAPAATNDMFCVHKDWVNGPEREQALQDFAESAIEAARWFRQKPEEWKALIKKELPETDDSILDPYHELLVEVGQYPPNGTAVNTAGVQDAVQLALDAGDIKQPVDVASFVDTKYEQAALKKLGQFTE